ncbi:Appr-1-p processing domain protein [Caldithrix abyssi DSM 13497]|uniref:Appr-1-p processing domain protein n=1 Tax=Caldithrix abyssi DSM 13497 TaxID=880073 RepID=H1XUN2_CALAY|nr:macro domain-containing protein [Caldithrix abyssi]APF16811.1 O-acetyl-ADP-ribose deacetylase (regulator of RNase III), contains Macro domain [Caldithrix abyssi DSM 13497]EHO40531.1 Appr-1-p processing domain protein [Caldithrix abyssi DSM 13497]
MITFTKGNIVQADAEALVNTVNCVGIMGKGIALQFKKAFPEAYFSAYQKACRKGELRPGRVQVWSTGSFVNPKYIINFPTKTHWKAKSKYEYIESGLQTLKQEIKRLGIRSVAIPPLGSGLGGLEWLKVKEMIEKAFEDMPDVKVLVYQPEGAPAAETMPVKKEKPKMTLARALFIKLMQFYSRHAYRLTLLEIQKLAYFLQEAGIPLRLKYVKHHYGPYAHNLNKVLEVIEGHFTRGYGDTQQPDVEISLLPQAVEKADAYLAKHAEARQKLEQVMHLVEGFETPYGMELLASVHWILKHEGKKDVVIAMQEWSDRKCKQFKPEHIKIAERRLREDGWG